MLQVYADIPKESRRLVLANGIHTLTIHNTQHNTHTRTTAVRRCCAFSCCNMSSVYINMCVCVCVRVRVRVRVRVCVFTEAPSTLIVCCSREGHLSSSSCFTGAVGHNSTSHHSTAQHSTSQHSTAQNSTPQHSTVQHSTV